MQISVHFPGWLVAMMAAGVLSIPIAVYMLNKGLFHGAERTSIWDVIAFPSIAGIYACALTVRGYPTLGLLFGGIAAMCLVLEALLLKKSKSA